jgi:transposase
MLTTNPSVPIYLHSEPIDMRKSFEGLFGIIKSDLNRDVRDGGLFVFLNQRLAPSHNIPHFCSGNSVLGAERSRTRESSRSQ